MKTCVIDIEADGLLDSVTKIYCIVCKEIESGEVLVFEGEDMRSGFRVYAQTVDLFVGHNVVGYDFPCIERILDIHVLPDRVFDTLIVSRLLNVAREGGHSLENWGEILKFKKMEHKDFSCYSPEMLEYCKNDVELTSRVYRHLKSIVDRNGEAFKRAIPLEHAIQRICLDMSRNGFHFNHRKACELDDRLRSRLAVLDERIQSSFAPVVKTTQLKTKVKTFTITADDRCLLKLPLNVVLIIKDIINKTENVSRDNRGSDTTVSAMKIINDEESATTQTTRKIKESADVTIKRTLKEFGKELEELSTDYLQQSLQSLFESSEAAVKCVADVKDLLSIIVTGQDAYVDCSALLAISLSASLKLSEVLPQLTSQRIREETIPFNPGSPKQIIDRLWEAGWKPSEKTKTHAHARKPTERDRKYGWKINEINLSTLPSSAPEGFKYLVEHIMLSARRRTLKEWFEAYDPKDHRIHGNFNPLGARSHRFIHSSPNMGNIATKKTIKYNTPHLRDLATQLGGEMRSFWDCPEGSLLIGTDMESAHLRIFAHLINDKSFIQALISGKKEDGTDPHSVNKKILGDICVDRDRAKTFIFSFLNGAGAGKVSEIFACNYDEAEEALDRFIKAYPGLARLKKKEFPASAKRGYFIGVDGRLVMCNSAHLMMGMTLQNYETVIMKQANVLWYNRLIKEKIPFKQVNFVHDEYVTEIGTRDRSLAEYVAKVQCDAIRETGELFKLNIPLSGEAKIGLNWLDVH